VQLTLDIFIRDNRDAVMKALTKLSVVKWDLFNHWVEVEQVAKEAGLPYELVKRVLEELEKEGEVLMRKWWKHRGSVLCAKVTEESDIRSPIVTPLKKRRIMDALERRQLAKYV